MRTLIPAWTVIVLAGLAGSSCSDSSGGNGGDASFGDLAGGGGGDLAGSGGELGVIDLGGGADLTVGDGPRASTDLSTLPTGGNCPNLVGAYTVSISGAGCGNLNVNAPECIGNISSSCIAQFQSGPGGQLGAVVGTANVQSDGSFSGAGLTLGTVDRTGCTGTWDAGTGTLVIDCGGMGSSQSCVVTLVRTSTSC